MPPRCLNDLNHVVALGGGHGLGRVMSALSSLGPRLTGIVTTTDNGGSTGRIRESEGGIAWGDARNCINQMITKPSVASAMFEYRFGGNGELSGHNLGNLMLKALDNLSVRPLDAINLIRELLKVDANLLPMTEHPTDLAAIDDNGDLVHGEVNIDKLSNMPRQLMLAPLVESTREAVEAIHRADLLIIGPGSFMTSLMPPLLLTDINCALQQNKAPIIYIDNLGKEHSAAGLLTLDDKLTLLEQAMQQRVIDAAIIGMKNELPKTHRALIVQHPLEADDIPYRHDRELLHQAIAVALAKLHQ
jgi:uncharacterized cofD-like protein